MHPSIIADLKESYGIVFDRIAPVSGGYLNQKWKVHSNQGELLIKQYDAKRFPREKIEKVEAALQRQIALKKMGVPCPLLWQLGGRITRRLSEDTVYMVMEFCPGRTETPGGIALSQMENLGRVCAEMHLAFSSLSRTLAGQLPAPERYSVDQLRETFRARMADCPPDANPEYRDALSSLGPVLERLSPGFFGAFPTALAHEDFHAGNILFAPEGVSAIVDFDRNRPSFPLHDVGRAILSFALEGEMLNTQKVRAFCRGHSRRAPLTPSGVADALRLTWCLETPWWIQPEYFEGCSQTAGRFKDEMLWLTKCWFELDDLLNA